MPKKHTIFSKDIIKNCGNCVYAKKLEFSEDIMCNKKGMVHFNDICKKYKYDPIKRVPSTAVISSDFSEDDFKI